MRFGIFTGFARPSRYNLEQMKQAGFTDAYLCLISKRNFASMRQPQDVERDVATIVGSGLVPHIMYWVFRDNAFIDSMVDHVNKSTRNVKVESILLNCEKDYHDGSFESQKCAKYIRAKLSNYRIGVVGLPSLHKTVKDLLAVCDYGMPEAYSIWFPQTESHWSHSKATFPGTMQDAAYLEWNHRPLVMGLACYFGARPASTAHPDMSKELTMSMSINETIRLGVDNMAFWSMPHIVRNTQLSNEILICLKTEFQRYRIPA